MSGVHFELSWDGARCLLRDREGAGGTWLNGQRLREGEVKSGEWIRAGNTVFMVYFEGAPERPRPADPPEVAETKARALATLQAEVGPLFALLDAARDRRVLELLRCSVEEHQSLYDGIKGETLSEVAPYLVSLPRGSALLEALVREGWGRSWGVYLTSRMPFKEARRHFRRILMVEIEEAMRRPRRVYFRFYDPRALRVILPRCNAKQRGEMFSGIEAYLLEGEDGAVRRFSAGDSAGAVARGGPAAASARG